MPFARLYYIFSRIFISSNNGEPCVARSIGRFEIYRAFGAEIACRWSRGLKRAPFLWIGAERVVRNLNLSVSLGEPFLHLNDAGDVESKRGC